MKRSVYEYWWQSLAAVPASERQHDWWATGTDGRWRPYDRLKRVWADQTSPKDNLHDPSTERHLTACLWENFSFLHPSVWIPRLLSVAGLPPTRGPVRDACWSYEFEQNHEGTRRGEKIADVVLHYRDDAGDALLVVEAKNLGRDLGPKDRDPGYYLDMRSFGRFPRPRRHLMYLVDEAKRPVVAGQVNAGTPWTYAVFTWQQMAALQVSLAGQLLDVPAGVTVTAAALTEELFVARHVSPVAGRQYRSSTCRRGADGPIELAFEKLEWSGAGIGGSCLWRLDDRPGDRDGEPADPPTASVIEVNWSPAGLLPSLADRFPGMPPQLLNYLAGAIQHRCLHEGLEPPSPAFAYLAKQPSFTQTWNTYRQQPEERCEPLWQLP